MTKFYSSIHYIRILGIFIIFGALFSVNLNYVLATSGACSYHGGVNCSAGPDYSDGSVICEDGWEDSSTSYWETEMCYDESSTFTSDYIWYQLLTYGKAKANIINNILSSYSDEELISQLQAESRNIWRDWALMPNDSENSEYKHLIDLAFGVIIQDLDLKISKLGTTSLFEGACNDSNGIYDLTNGSCYTPSYFGILQPGEGWTCPEGYSYDNQKLDCFLDSPTFSDLEANNINFNAIIYLYKNGIVSGYEDGTFKPNAMINRAELLKILVEGKDINPDQTIYSNCFPDVTDDWYAKYVCYAKQEGWVSGYPDGTFRPASTVNKVEALKMLLNSQSTELVGTYQTKFEDVDTAEWFAPYVFTAESLGLLEESSGDFLPNGEMKRAGISENLYRLLTL